MTDAAPDTEELLRRAGRGDAAATGTLFERHRGRLRRVVGVRMDRRLAARMDHSDVVQESLADAARRLATCETVGCRFSPGSGGWRGTGSRRCTGPTSVPPGGPSCGRSR